VLRLLIVTLIGLWGTLALAKAVEGVRVWPSAENTRIVLDLSDNIQYKLFTLENPCRMVLDLQDVEFKAKINPSEWQANGIKKIRYSQFNTNTLRIVFDLEKGMMPKSFILNPEKNYGHRLVIDLGGAEKIKKINRVLSMPIKLVSREFIVAIDAGHGGQDPGSIGLRRHVREKEVVLSVAKKLQNLINAQSGMRAYLVRKGDYYVSLRKRMELARAEGADLFVSIHADSFKDPKASGASVYVLSEKGASNEAARWLAERENRADLVGGIRLEDKSDLLASVLLDLSQTANQTASNALAGHLIARLGEISDLHHKAVQHASFMVLKSPDIPSVLVELGFLSNPKGEEKLADPAYQKILAKALFAGVNAYLATRTAPLKHPQDFDMANKISVRRV
jgi:N-acetylmuramoyl-L-alanine amidase